MGWLYLEVLGDTCSAGDGTQAPIPAWKAPALALGGSFHISQLLFPFLDVTSAFSDACSRFLTPGSVFDSLFPLLRLVRPSKMQGKFQPHTDCCLSPGAGILCPWGLWERRLGQTSPAASSLLWPPPVRVTGAGWSRGEL